MNLRRAVVDVKGVTKKYPGTGKEAVSNLSLSLYPGEIVALLGPNGAGKTTVVKMIAGLVLPSQGTVHVAGHNIVKTRTQGVRHIGAVLEGARNLYWRLSAVENLRYFGTLRLVPGRKLGQRIEELLAFFDLEADCHKEVRHYSRGMQQKLAIAAALLHDPDVLLLDEPTLGLDVKAARLLESRVAHLAKEEGKAILLTTHQMELAEKLTQYIKVIHRGQEVLSEKTETLLQQYEVQRRFTEIKVKGSFPSSLLDDMRRNFPEILAVVENGSTRLTLPSLKQETLLHLLHQLNTADLLIQHVEHRQARLEEIFLALTEMGEDGK